MELFEADRIDQAGIPEIWQIQSSNGRIQCCKWHILGHHIGTGEAVE